MNNITVIFTVHKENGAANAQALFEVLEDLTPEVVFLEVSEKGFESYTSYPGLENKAIAMHLERAHPKLVPVDVIAPKLADFHLYNKLFAFLDAHSGDVSINIQREMMELVSSDGFKYLNSKKYVKAQSDLDVQEAKIIKLFGDSEIKDIYRKWRSANSDREQGMVDNIYSYCEACKSINAVYLVGAAHRIGLEAKIMERIHSMPDVKFVIRH